MSARPVAQCCGVGYRNAETIPFNMWPYLLVFVAALAVDTIPIFAPPAWILLVVLLVKFHLNPWLTVVIGVTGSTIGRYVLTRYIPKISSRLVNRREDANLRYIGGKIGKANGPQQPSFFSTRLRRSPRPRSSPPSR